MSIEAAAVDMETGMRGYLLAGQEGFLDPYTDGRRRSSAANDFYSSGSQDFSFGNFDGDSLLVEARPRDDGFTLETYTLQAGGNQLVVKMQIQPNSFGAAIMLTRVYDRVD